MSASTTPQPGTSVTISYTHGSWEWADGTARCHGFDTPASAARDWESRRTVYPAPAPRAWQDAAREAMAAHGRPRAVPSGDDDWSLPAWLAACGQCGRPPGQCLPWCAMNDAPVTRR